MRIWTNLQTGTVESSLCRSRTCGAVRAWQRASTIFPSRSPLTYAQCYLFVMLNPDPDFYPSRSRIQDSTTNEKGEIFFSCLTFFSSQISQNWKLFYFSTGTENCLSQLTKNYYTFYQKLSLNSEKYGLGIRDTRSGKNLSRIQGPKKHRIPDPDPQHCLLKALIRTLEF